MKIKTIRFKSSSINLYIYILKYFIINYLKTRLMSMPVSNSTRKFNDVENNIENFRALEEEECLAKIYEQNLEKINIISQTIKITQITGLSFFLIFLILLAIRVNKNFNFSWFILLIPALTCLTSYTVLFNMYLKLKDIFDEAEKSKEDDDTSQIGSLITYFCLNFISLNIFVYLVLFCLRVENVILTQWNLISIPIYITLGIAFFYWIFILPAFFQNKLYIEILLIFVYISCLFVFILLLNFKLDNNYTKSFTKIFIPIMFVLGLHMTLMLININEALKNGEILKNLTGIGFIVFSLISAILTFLKADQTLDTYDYYLPVVIFILGYILCIFDQILILCFRVNESEDSNSNSVDKDLHS